MQRLANPLPFWFDTFGALLDGGYVYVGTARADPETAPIDLFFDAELTIPAAQPLRTVGGVIANGANAATVYLSEDDYSLRWRESTGEEVAYLPSAVEAAAAYQPLSATLTALAALSTTSFGRTLLTLANQAGLQAAVGLPAALPLTGGNVTGNIVRTGAGTHLYHSSSAMTSGRVFLTAVGAADPTSQPGDIWLAW